jgi:hypothetical protein
MRRWNEVLLVALRSSKFPFANTTNWIILVCLVNVLCALECTGVMQAQRIFQRFRMGNFYEEYVCVKFCFKLRQPLSETFKMLKQVFIGRSLEYNTNP